jgi:hypothetical protein
MEAADFGTTVKTVKPVSASIASTVLSQDPRQLTPPKLPTAANRKMNSDIIAEKPLTAIRVNQAKVGAAPRIRSAPLDNELRTKRVLIGRPPVNGGEDGIKPTGGVKEPRKTGVIERQPPVRPPAPVKQPPVYNDPPADSEPARVKSVKVPREPVKSDPAPTRQPPRYEAPPVKTTPREHPPVKQPPRSVPPPVKSEPKPESKPSKQPASAAG